MRDMDLQDPRITAIERNGEPQQHFINPTLQAEELIQVVELTEENYAEIIENRIKQLKGNKLWQTQEV